MTLYQGYVMKASKYLKRLLRIDESEKISLKELRAIKNHYDKMYYKYKQRINFSAVDKEKVWQEIKALVGRWLS